MGLEVDSMEKYPIEKFYVGKINFGFKIDDFRAYQAPTRQGCIILSVKDITTFNGAIDVQMMTSKLTDLENRIMYNKIFTIFYKNDDNNYTSLHNGTTYQLSGETYCSDLVPLSSCIPDVASRVDKEITCLKAKQIFEILFESSKKSLYTCESFPLDYFYFANLELYTGESENMRDANLAQRLILNSKGIRPYGKSSNYEFYKVIVLWLLDKMNNINDCRSYKSSVNPDGSKLEIISSLKENPYFNSNIGGDKTDIPQIIRLQRKYNKA